jgi:hypothetical protein
VCATQGLGWKNCSPYAYAKYYLGYRRTPPVHFGNPVPTTEATFASTSDRMTHAERIQHRTNESSGDSAEIESDERP